ncbi:MAG: ATP-binding protein [Chloroflexi bacterium]|nr:ATP-binding protein [Chloroflexota bacterium]
MTLRKKTLIAAGLTLALLIASLYAVRRVQLVSDFSQLERDATSENVGRAVDALNNEMSGRNVTADDWAGWDDTYAFMQDLNTKYAEANLGDSTFLTLHLNLLLIVDNNGDIVFGDAFDLSNETRMPLPDGLEEHLLPGDALLNHSDPGSSVTGVLVLLDQPVLVASRPITTSQGEGPIRGTLIMGRYLDDAEVQQLAEITHLGLGIHLVDDLQMAPDLQSARSALLDGSTVVVEPLSSETVAGYSLVNDIYGQPALLLRVDTPRDIYHQGQLSLRYVLVSSLIVGLVFSALLLFMLERFVLSRLARISRDVKTIAASGDRSARVAVSGSDELSVLGDSINGMLQTLDSAYEREQEWGEERDAELRKRVELTRALVHELKTPLTPIVAASDLLLDHARDEITQTLARSIQKGADSLNKRVSELLDVARSELGTLTLKRKEVDPVRLIRQITDEMTPLASSQHQLLTLEMPPALPSLWADEERLRQVMLNLVDNAIKFTPQGGTITIRAKEEGPSLMVEVQDTGPGILEKNWQRIFEPYYRVHPDGGRTDGLGLGLALCKTIVTLHEGRIWVESEFGKGSSFYFTIPLSTAGSER